MNNEIIVGVMQRTFQLNPDTVKSLNNLTCKTIVIDSTPNLPVVKETANIKVFHIPDEDGFYNIALLIPLFQEFLKSSAKRLFLIEGDFVLTSENIQQALSCKVNTKVFYVESDPQSKYAYVRREGLAGVLLREEIEKIYSWMRTKPIEIFKKYKGLADTFLWYSVSNEASGYSETSTAGEGWIKVLHITHDDKTRLGKIQRRNMKEYRKAIAYVISIAMECNEYTPT